MIIQIDTILLEKEKLSPNGYVFLSLFYNNEESTLEVSKDLISKLEELGYIKDTIDGLILRKKAIDLFTNKMPNKQKDLEDFVEKYRNLFPQGVKSGGRIVKGDKQGCLAKIKRFNSKYSEYTQQDILDATKAYLDLKRKVNWDKCVCADYFILKDGLSMLAGYCEDIKLRGKQIEKGEIGKTKGI